MYRTDFWTLWEKARVGCFKRTASKHVYYLGWNRSPAQIGCMRQVLRPGVLGRPRGIRWRGRWEGGSVWGIHVYPRLIHVNVWQKPLQYCKVIRLQLILKKIFLIKKKKVSGCQLILKESPSLEFQLTLWLLFPQLFVVFNNKNFVIYQACFSYTGEILDHHDLFFPDQKLKSFTCMLPIKRMLSWLHFH